MTDPASGVLHQSGLTEVKNHSGLKVTKAKLSQCSLSRKKCRNRLMDTASPHRYPESSGASVSPFPPYLHQHARWKVQMTDRTLHGSFLLWLLDRMHFGVEEGGGSAFMVFCFSQDGQLNHAPHADRRPLFIILL